MKRFCSRHVLAFAAALGLALAALAFYSVRDFLAAFFLFSMVFIALGLALFAVLSAEEALVWLVHRTERYFGRFRARHLAFAANPTHLIRFRRAR